MGSRNPLGTDETITGPRPDDSSQALPVGTMVGEYCIEGTLGEGGMGRVFAAVHPVIAKRAAIKVLHPELSVNRQAVERFVQEARAVNQIGHPNIVDIFAFGTLPDGRCYFVMEQLRGESLKDRIDRKPAMSIGETLAILDTITIALEAAHEKNIIHRDLKPDNIFLVEVRGDRPIVKLLDFGIAKLLGNDDSRAQRTRTGNVLGTPAYISPEQARGQGVDHRTDVYALGALAFEMLAGQLPFPAESAADMIAKHLYQAPPSVRSINPQVPLELDALVTRMLAKDVTHRPTLAMTRDQLRACRAQATNQPMSFAPAPSPDPFVSGQRPAGLVTTIAPSAGATALGSTLRVAPISMTGSTSGRSRGWILGLCGVLVIAGGIAAAIVMLGGKKLPAEPAGLPATAVETKPAVTPDAEAKPEPPAPSVEPIEAKPIDPAAPPVVDEPPPEATKPAAKPTKPIKRPKPKPKSDDDDAPM